MSNLKAQLKVVNNELGIANDPDEIAKLNSVKDSILQEISLIEPRYQELLKARKN